MILVTGATGNVGGALVAALAEAGEPVRALSRRAPEQPWPRGVEGVTGDLDDATSLRDALDGATGLFLLAGYAGTRELLAAGRRAGLDRVVLLGSAAMRDELLEAPTSTNAVIAYNQEAERAVRASQLAFAVLRPVGFHANALRWAEQLEQGDVVAGPWPEVPIASIDPADIAAVAAVALRTGRLDGRALRLTGPEALRPAERVSILGEVLGRPLRFEAQDDSTARAELLAGGWPPEYADAFFRFFSEGETDETSLSPAVQDVLGRPPRSFAAWAAEHAGKFGT